ncbi:ABC transporter ATP-binding protein [Agrococcus casei]|uniref:ABC transporter, ATP-binding protein n=1 Tax=Agrococcus casei LMG 22410 TaxID=1255656 RepID=A0A1R4FSH0_9MICO|nr:ABC transporter ATP-binding protein [Agrococcus casei]SJM58767.1 ABC transporter, ATP-binding protein [Agrococcus casei LMG 22410]
MVHVLEFNDVSVVRNGRAIIDGLTWRVDESERWVILGPNGAGKSTILQLAAAMLHPTKGEADVLGERLGRVNVFDLRTRIGFSATNLARRIPPYETVDNAILTAAYAVTGRWREEYDKVDHDRAREVIEAWDLEALAARTFGTLSDGEQKRVQVARAVMTDPELMLLDEPAGSLDLGAREDLLYSLTEYAKSPLAPAIVMVTHHVEEIPPGFTHAMLLADGKAVHAGPIGETITNEKLSEAFGRSLEVSSSGDRYTARAAD